MQYLLLIQEPRGQRAQRTRAEGEAVYERMVQFGAGLQERGVLVSSQSLAGDDAGVRVQVRAGERRLVDGPFSEAKEMVGGFFLIDCASQEQALAIAAECPAAGWAAVEVRPVGPCYV